MSAIRSPLQQQTRGCAVLSLALLAILLLLGTTAFAILKYSNASLSFAGITFGGGGTRSSATGIGVTTTAEGEQIGVSDGTYAFDIGSGRSNGSLKTQASSALRRGDASSAVVLWKQAVAHDTNDAESLIYLEDQHVLSTHQPYITLVVGTMLTGNDASILSTGRDNLQGAYVAQKQYNDGAKLGNILVCLFIASAGSQSNNVTSVAQQVVQAATHDHHIVGVMGWPYSSYVSKSYQVLSDAHIPMVSPTASSNSLSNISPYFFRIAPPNKVQAVAGARYAEQQLRTKSAAIFVDTHDPYSQTLADEFKQQFKSDGNSIVATENYTVGKPANIASLLQDAVNAKPDLIYFAGYASDMSVLLTNFQPSTSNIQLLGGDGLYQIQGYASSARAGFERLHFTAFAYPDEWGYRGHKNPEFFTIYAFNFDPANIHPGAYGYTRPDGDVILSYDATITLLQGCKNALGNSTSMKPEALRQGLTSISSVQALQGISGQISFGATGDPLNKAVVILTVDPTGHIQLTPSGGAIQGCFLIEDRC